MKDLCNCGRPVRYMSDAGGSCSKYGPCPTYDELLEQLSARGKEIAELKQRVYLLEGKLVDILIEGVMDGNSRTKEG